MVKRLIISGFTGTQVGMTARQEDKFRRLICKIGPDVFHHGDCIGADEEAHAIVMACTLAGVVIHPPDNDRKRAWCAHPLKPASNRVSVLAPHPYLVRNRHIVAASTHLIATPAGMREEQRSGTWATIRAARRIYMPTFIIWPNGKVERQN